MSFPCHIAKTSAVLFHNEQHIYVYQHLIISQCKELYAHANAHDLYDVTILK